MKIQLKPAQQNTWPIAASYVQANTLEQAFDLLQHAGLSNSDVKVYLHLKPTNNLKGIVVEHGKQEISNSPFMRLQAHSSGLFIPEYTSLVPLPSEEKLRNAIQDKYAIGLPNQGFTELLGPLNLEELLLAPNPHKNELRQFAEKKEERRRLEFIYVKLETAEESLARIENLFPKENEPITKPLTIWDRIQFGLLKLFFFKSGSETKPTALGKSLMPKRENDSSWFKRQQTNFEKLNERNQREIDKLIDLLSKDPERGLNHAIPISDSGFGRGSGNAVLPYLLNFKWFTLKLHLGNTNSNSSGGTINLEADTINKLVKKYEELATDFAKKGEYEKAAFVYLKLLRNKYMAAQMLEKAGKYIEAAKTYLSIGEAYSFIAAVAYLKGNDYQKALQLFIQSKSWEQAGDLLTKLNDPHQAREMYLKKIDELKSGKHYLGAGDFAINKLEDFQLAYDLYKTGWQTGNKGQSCLKGMLKQQEPSKQLELLSDLIPEASNLKQKQDLIGALHHAYKTAGNSANAFRLKAFSCLSSWAEKEPSLLNQLKGFNQNNTSLSKEIQRFKKLGKS